MWRDIQRKRRWFAAVLIISGIFTAGLLCVICYVCSYGEEDNAVQVNETLTHDSSSDRQEAAQLILSLGETSDTVTVSWKGHTDCTSYFRYGRTSAEVQQAGYLQTESQAVFGDKYIRNSVTLTDLEPDQEYHYEISTDGEAEWSGTFRAPDDGRKTSFIYMGDVQVKSEDYAQWASGAQLLYEQNRDVDFAVIGGDIVSRPTNSRQWKGFFENSGLFSRLPLMTVPGNHEGASSNNTYKKLFCMPLNGPDIKVLKESFYYFDQGCCRFIMMDSSFLTDERKEKLGEAAWERCESAVEEWLAEILAESGKSWNIVVVHHPPYGLHNRDTVSPEIRKLWSPIMEKGGVDLVLSGHQHVYMRSCRINGITYVMGNSGDMESRFYTGNNAPAYAKKVIRKGYNYQLVTADSRKLKLICVNKKGSVIDEAFIEKESRFHIFELFGGNQIVI